MARKQTERTIRGILIIPETREVKEVEVKTGSKEVDSIDELLQVDIFTVLNWNKKGETLYVDDEGLLKDPHFFFRYPGYPEWLAGRGLILGTKSDGSSKSSALDLEEVRKMVIFGMAR